MADLLPSSPSADAIARERDPRVIGVDSDAADDLLSALSSETARKLLAALHDEPTTPADLAERVDTSLQNAQYHLGKLESAELIEVADTCYSEKGREMKVYAPTDRPLVVFAGREEETTGLKAALSRILGAVGVLAGMSLLVQWFLGAQGRAGEAGASDVGFQTQSAEVAAQAADAGAAGAGLPPGLLFFAGGSAMFLVGAVWWYLQNR